MRSGRVLGAAVFTAIAALVGSACSGETLPAGGVMVAFSSDMSMPKDVDTLDVIVTQNGVVLFQQAFSVGPAPSQTLPATLLLLPPHDRTSPVQVRVAALHAGTPLVLRDAILVVPTNQIAELRMPVEWLCEGSAAKGPETASGEATYVATLCPTVGQTCAAGACAAATVDSASLPTYDPGTIFGGGTGARAGGSCMDTIACFADGAIAPVDESTCTIAAPSGGMGTNVAILVGSMGAGICGPEACLVPLDGQSSEGWQSTGGRIQLPPALCSKLASGEAAGVVTTTACATKEASEPTCGAWSSVAGGVPDAGQDIAFDAAEAGNGMAPDATVSDAAGADATVSDATVSDGAVADAVVAEDAQDGGELDADAGSAVACPTGLQCNVSCGDGGTTTVTGTVYDPAAKNPLYNVAVYVPAGPLLALPKGVPTGADACSCSALFKTPAITSTTTNANGSFTLANVPVGSGVPLVLQVGKWRRRIAINVTACQPNPQPDKSLAFLGTIPGGDTDDDMPDIAVSTGSADTLECILVRMGIAASEYVAGASTAGHVHLFSGGDPADAGGGTPEKFVMAGSPPSYTALWDSQAHLMPYDAVLLSCESEETFGAVPVNLEGYVNAGGRAFASHFHYAWFAGPLDGTSGQVYAAPADWGASLATWAGGSNPSGASTVGGIIDTALNGDAGAFVKGEAFASWLGNVGALGSGGVPVGELPIETARFNASVTATNAPSQAWIVADPQAEAGASTTMTFSFDTPVNAPVGDAGVRNYCGRAYFSDLHVGAAQSDNTSSAAPGGCASGNLSPQEKAIEFMLFDLSSCVVSDDAPP